MQKPAKRTHKHYPCAEWMVDILYEFFIAPVTAEQGGLREETITPCNFKWVLARMN